MENKNGKVKCEICGKEISAKGLKMHIKMAHASKPEVTKGNNTEVTDDKSTHIEDNGTGKIEVIPDLSAFGTPLNLATNISEATETTPFIPAPAKRPDADVAAVEIPKAPVQDIELSHKQNLYRRNRKG